MSQATKKRGKTDAPPASSKATEATNKGFLEYLFAGLFGVLLGLSLLKFGNPVIMEKLISWPANIYEWILVAWPVAIGYRMLFVVVIVGFLVARAKPGLPLVLVWLPAAWLVWELFAATKTEAARLSNPTVVHFLTCVVCFYLGLFALGGSRRMGAFWSGLVPGFLLVLCSGLSQHFGGLEESRKYFLNLYPNPGDLDVNFIKKLSSGRIFATLFYPNTLAGAILLLMPVTLALLWSLRERFTAGARRFLVGSVALAALGCLFWSGSKGGWLLMLVLAMVGAMYLPMKKQFKVMLVAAVLVLGLTGFTAKYLGFFKKGATSVVARFDYWEAAMKTVNAQPVFGSGPGTFGVAYARLKRPESEMAQLAHNDYLQQASDSGWPGFLLYAAMIVGTLVYTWRKGGLGDDWVKLAVWLGVLGWALQGLMEFGLYIPALAWPTFAFMGWLLAQCSNPSDSAKTTSYSGVSQ